MLLCAAREEAAGGFPRTKSNISSFVERSSREEGERERKKKGGEWIGRKREKYIYWKETRCKCIRFTVKSTGESVQKVSLHQRQVITYTHETPEFKVEVNYLAKDLRLGRHLAWMTLARGPRVSSFFLRPRISLIDDAAYSKRREEISRLEWKLSIANTLWHILSLISLKSEI